MPSSCGRALLWRMVGALEFKVRERKWKRRFDSDSRAKCLKPSSVPVAKDDSGRAVYSVRRGIPRK
jgi:hypothetical protein